MLKETSSSCEQSNAARHWSSSPLSWSWASTELLRFTKIKTQIKKAQEIQVQPNKAGQPAHTVSLMSMLGDHHAQKEAACLWKVQITQLLSKSQHVSCVKGFFLLCFNVKGESFLLKTVSKCIRTAAWDTPHLVAIVSVMFITLPLPTNIQSSFILSFA